MMRIVDWRPRVERRLAESNVSRRGKLARLAGRVADLLAARRVAGRDHPPRDVLVVSVGNLRVGGTGKTPVVTALARDLAARGIGGAVITRGHGSKLPGPQLVEPDLAGAGDEARVMAADLADTGWQVIQDRRRERGVAHALAAEPRPRVILLEDAHQTARVGRHLDVLIIDRWKKRRGVVVPAPKATLPFGPYRETAAGADRAGIWVVEEDAGQFEGPQGVTLTGFQRVLSFSEPPPVGEKLGLVSGLARPEGFEQGVTEALDQLPRLAIRCGDHCRYDARLVKKIVGKGRRRGVAAWLTTAKDWVKLAPLWPAGLPMIVVGVTVRWTGMQTLPDLVEERLTALGAGP
jgi:tetraacyldisaccharide 4'-kinase